MGRGLKIILILWLSIFSGQLRSQDSTIIELSFDRNEFTIIPSGEHTFAIKADPDEYFYNDDQNLPAIPIKNISVLVPNGAEMVDFNYSVHKTLMESDINLELTRAVSPTLPIVQIMENDFVFDGIYPEKPVQYTCVSVQRGFTLLNFRFSPFIYNGNNHSLDFISQLSLKVKYKINQSKVTSIHPDLNLIHELKESISNPEALKQLYNTNAEVATKSAKEKVDYLIVTNKNLAESFKPLIQWKNRKGLYAEVVTTEEIYQKYDGPTRQLKIKRCLLDYYENNGLKWVLLGGDIGVVPVQYCFDAVTQDTTNLNRVPTDLFYACFDARFDWNSVEDENIGQLFFDGHDFIPDVYLTRLPVNTVDEAKAFVNKTLKYETNPVVSNSIGKTIFAGVKLWKEWNGKSDSHHRSEVLFKRYVRGNTLGENFYFLDTGTDFNAGADHDVTTTNLKEKLNKGFGLLHFTGHGFAQSLNMEAGLQFGPNDVFNLTNEVGGLVLTNACSTNAFDQVDPSFSEALIRNPNGGCLAYFGSSRYGYGNPLPSSELGASLKFNATFLDYIFNEKRSSSMTFGEIATLTKNRYANGYGPSNKFFAYLMYAINPIGDPELPLYRGIPKTFQNIRIYEIGNSLHVNTGGVENSRICITSRDMDDGYMSRAEHVSFHTFESVPEQFQLTVTAPNYRPYTFISGSVTGISSTIKTHINVFPNPVSKNLNIDFGLSEGLLQIYDVNGKLWKEQPVTYGSNHINVADFPEGILIINISANEGSAKYKIVKYND